MKIVSVEEVKELVDVLKKASDLYYNYGESVLTDLEFDIKKDNLISIYENYLIPKKSQNLDLVKEVEEFLIQIGSTVTTSEWKKSVHKFPMTSLNKVNTLEEFLKWSNVINDSSYLILDKVDGGSIDLVYEDSKLVDAITRGDGKIGESLLVNVLKMKNVKSYIPGFTGNLKGEIIMTREDFEVINKISDREYKNPRNTATGLCKTLDGVNVDLLSVLFYDIDDDSEQFNTEEEKLNKIESFGVKTCFWKKVSIEEAIKVYDEYINSIRASLNFDIDGLVIRANTIEVQQKHGMLGENFKAKIAWKFPPMTKETYLRDVEWHLGNSCRITPIGILEPTMMGGVVIKRCSLYNIDMFKEMRYTKNCKVLLVRANDVIPKILKNISDGDSEFEIPLICPECGEKVEIKGKNLMCVNNFCSGLGIGNLKHWVNVLDIYELGPKIIEMLYTKGLVKEPADFYTLTIDKLIELDRMGEKSALTIIKNLKAKMEITLSQFISGLNIPNFGERTTISLIDAGYNEIEKIFNAQEKDLIKIKGIEVKTASQIIKGIKEKVNIINRLLEVGIKIKKLEKSKTVSNKFVDLSFCFTGTIQSIKTDGKRFTREDMHSIVISNGGKAEDSVRKGLTYLVMADPSSTSGKAQKAREIGVKLLSEIDFFNMIKE